MAKKADLSHRRGLAAQRWEVGRPPQNPRRQAPNRSTRTPVRDVLARLREAHWAVARDCPSVPATRRLASSSMSG
jgi:hypothetical protein